MTVLLFSSLAKAAVEIDYQFNPPKVNDIEVAAGFGTPATHRFARPETSRDDGYDSVSLPGTHKFAERPGIPLLPVKTAKILIPDGVDLQEIRVITGARLTLPGIYNLEYSKTPVHMGSKQKVEDRPDPAVYGSDKPFPGKLFDQVSIQFKRGFKILILNLYPVQYIPLKGEVSYFESFKVIVETAVSKAASGKRGVRKGDIELIKKEVDNPSAAATYAVLDGASPGTSRLSERLQNYEYVIITSDALSASFQQLANHKISRGISATVVSTAWIYANYSGIRPDGGSDDQTRIRNFIIDAFNNWGVEYVLLGGDDEIIPHRGVYGYVASIPPEADNDIPADLYYGCLDGTWDNDADGIYGESNDGVGGGEVDLLAEVYVGRATVDTTTEADNFINKTIAYELSTPSNSAVMVGTQLDSYPTWGGDYKDDVAAYFPSGWSITTLYDRDGTCNNAAVVNALNSNQNAVFNHMGHGNNGSFMYISRSDVDGLTNTTYFYLYDQACYTASFDNRLTSSGSYDPAGDSIAEHFVENDTGAFAYIGNSRYGWYVQGSTNGASQQFDQEFFDGIHNEGIVNLGKTVADAKEDLVGTLGSTGANRYCYFEINLLGDPETQVGEAESTKGSILHFSESLHDSTVSRMRNMGYDVTESTDPSDLTRTNLGSYDVLWIGYSTSPSFYASQNGEIRSWVSEDGGGLIVEQPDYAGAVTVFPPGFEVDITSNSQPTTYEGCIANSSHPITQGLSDTHLSGNFDQVEDADIGSQWDILARDCDATSQIVLLAGNYGSGKLIFNTHNFGVFSPDRGSNQYLSRLLDWTGSGAKTSVLIVAADYIDSINNVAAMLQGNPDLELVDIFDAQLGTPSLAELQQYDVVLTWSDYTYYDAVALGNVLADYVDRDGKVIVAMFAMGVHGWELQGRFMNEGYCPISGTDPLFQGSSLGVHDSDHAIMQGVTDVSCEFRLDGTYLTPGSTEVARWADGNIFVAVKDDATTVALGGYVADFWTGDMDNILTNSVKWLTTPPPVIDDVTFDRCISEFCTSGISVSAHDPEGGDLTYGWQPLDGGDILGSGAEVEFDPPDVDPQPCSYRVKVTVTSGATGLFAEETVSINVKRAGDVDGNGVVNVVDKVLVRNSFGKSGNPGWIDADVNCDGYVNVVDKVLVRNQFGETGCVCGYELYEDFNDNVADNWVDDGADVWSVGEGVYKMTGMSTGEVRYSYYDQDFDDFTYEVDVRRTQGSLLHAQGMVFRWGDTGENGYVFHMGANGKYLILKVINGSYTFLIPSWTDSDAIDQGYDVWNTLKVVCSGTTMEFYINDTLVESLVDSEFYSGRVGVKALDAGSTPANIMHFDNARLSLDAPLSGVPAKPAESIPATMEAGEVSP